MLYIVEITMPVYYLLLWYFLTWHKVKVNTKLDTLSSAWHHVLAENLLITLLGLTNVRLCIVLLTICKADTH